MYFVDYDTGEISGVNKAYLVFAINKALPNRDIQSLRRMDIPSLIAIASRISRLDGFCYTRREAEQLSKVYRARGGTGITTGGYER